MVDEPFVDAHIHFWDKSVERLHWAWLEPGYQFRKWTSHPDIDAHANACLPHTRSHAIACDAPRCTYAGVSASGR